jgi:hypothetical protein
MVSLYFASLYGHSCRLLRSWLPDVATIYIVNTFFSPYSINAGIHPQKSITGFPSPLRVWLLHITLCSYVYVLHSNINIQRGCTTSLAIQCMCTLTYINVYINMSTTYMHIAAVYIIAVLHYSIFVQSAVMQTFNWHIIHIGKGTLLITAFCKLLQFNKL